MAIHLSDKDIEIIVKVLDGWTTSKKLTWDNLISAVQLRLGRKYSRQSFSRHERIKNAYSLKKQFLRNSSADKPEVKSVELQKALERIERLKSENERLKSENTALLEQFARWAYNAHTKGLDADFLNQPLVTVDREKTKI